jgi:hypothetical protein
MRLRSTALRTVLLGTTRPSRADIILFATAAIRNAPCLLRISACLKTRLNSRV